MIAPRLRSLARRAAAGLALLLSVAPAVARTKPVEIDHWLWTAEQFPAYRAAAEAFNRANPDVRVKVTQISWANYWISLTTALISESAPDVFVNHLTRYPELLRNNTLADLAPFAARDGVTADRYVGSLYANWSLDGGQFGLPKDWDTIALAFNRAALAEAGVSHEELETLEWNPADGGSFTRMLARLSRDASGRDGLAPDFNPRQVVRHGLSIDGRMDGFGQAQWSLFAASLGFVHNDGPWARSFRFDDPRLAQTLHWLREAQRSGFITPASDARQLGAAGIFASGKSALSMTGTWTVNWLQTNCRFELGFAPLPIGPLGRKSMFNGIADSMWSGTKHPEEAWRWMRFLNSLEGQMIIADHGVVLPSIREAAERAVEVMSTRGGDVSVYLEQAVLPGGTFPYPTTDFGSDIIEITRIGMDRIFIEGADIPATLRAMNREVNALFTSGR